MNKAARDISKLLDPQRAEWMRYATTTAERMGESSMCLTLFTKEYGRNIDSLLQFALSVVLDKPIFLLVPRGTTLPANVQKVARAIEYFTPGDDADLRAATDRLMSLARQLSLCE